MELERSLQIFEKYCKIWNFMKIRPLGAELFHASGKRSTWQSKQSFFAIIGMRLQSVTCVRLQRHFLFGVKYMYVCMYYVCVYLCMYVLCTYVCNVCIMYVMYVYTYVCIYIYIPTNNSPTNEREVRVRGPAAYAVWDRPFQNADHHTVYFLSLFLVRPPLSNHFKCRQLLLPLTILRSKQARAHSVRLPGQGIGPSQRSTSQHKTFTRGRNPCPWRGSNTESQQASGSRPVLERAPRDRSVYSRRW